MKLSRNIPRFAHHIPRVGIDLAGNISEGNLDLDTKDWTFAGNSTVGDELAGWHTTTPYHVVHRLAPFCFVLRNRMSERSRRVRC